MLHGGDIGVPQGRGLPPRPRAAQAHAEEGALLLLLLCCCCWCFFLLPLLLLILLLRHHWLKLTSYPLVGTM